MEQVRGIYQKEVTLLHPLEEGKNRPGFFSCGQKSPQMIGTTQDSRFPHFTAVFTHVHFIPQDTFSSHSSSNGVTVLCISAHESYKSQSSTKLDSVFVLWFGFLRQGLRPVWPPCFCVQNSHGFLIFCLSVCPSSYSQLTQRWGSSLEYQACQASALPTELCPFILMLRSYCPCLVGLHLQSTHSFCGGEGHTEYKCSSVSSAQSARKHGEPDTTGSVAIFKAAFSGWPSSLPSSMLFLQICNAGEMLPWGKTEQIQGVT